MIYRFSEQNTCFPWISKQMDEFFEKKVEMSNEVVIW